MPVSVVVPLKVGRPAPSVGARRPGRARGCHYHVGNDTPRSWINNRHLLASQPGGRGTDLDDLFACSRSFNHYRMCKDDPGMSPNMYTYQEQVGKSAELGQAVKCAVTPHYRDERTVPYKAAIGARGVYAGGRPGDTVAPVDVCNSLRSTRDRCFSDLGGVTDSRTGLPVTVGSTP
ncbi:hypothetical protein ACIQF6_17065 [Kitasatospora sp. NPDC092948]|uniref:hypothetical protein n=1 Tax=Kitasatospora sp. NPDC092948 TaxID=3364088 RepID=UPI0037F1E2E3